MKNGKRIIHGMKPEYYIKKYALKHRNNNEPYTSILLYSLVYIKRHKTLYFFDSIFNDDYTDFEIKIINKSSKKTLEEQLRDMFIFPKDLDPKYDYQTLELIDKTGYATPANGMANIVLSYVRWEKDEGFKLCDISNNCKGDIKII
jgi:hypothetical protein